MLCNLRKHQKKKKKVHKTEWKGFRGDNNVAKQLRTAPGHAEKRAGFIKVAKEKNFM